MGAVLDEFVELTHKLYSPTIKQGPDGPVQIYNISEMQAKIQEVLADADFVELKKSVKEMITTSQGSMDLLEKVRVDVDFGLAEVPILYGPLYDLIPGPFPGGVVQINENTLQGNVIFFEKYEGGEVYFGTLAKGAPSTVTIQTYGAAFEWTEDMIEFDRTWDITLNNRAFGRAYNAFLNHLHLGPFIAWSYAGGNTTAADSTGSTLEEKTLITFRNAYSHAVQATPQRTWNTIIANEANRFQIEDALLTPIRDSAGNPLARVPVSTIIYYNGYTIQNGVESVTYPGVTAGTVYCVFPKQKLKELVHHDLRIDVGPPDITRLIEGQQVGRARRGVYADIAGTTEKLTLP